MKKQLKLWIKKALFGVFFALTSIFGLLSVTGLEAPTAYAIPIEDDITVERVDAGEEQIEVDGAEEEASETKDAETGDKSCKKSLGPIGWLVCPTTGKIAEAVDWLYDKIENILVINPIPAEDGSPIYEIWKYLKGVTNIVFIIFLLIVIYSQITGFGINNYGIKKALPKLIVTAILVNLSFLICQVLVDVSNIFGDGLRGVFTTISEAAIPTNEISGISHTSYAEMYSAIGSGTAIAAGAGVIAFEFGMIWMLIPLVLGALVAVVTGLITIALRQAVVALLIMVAPLAMVANLLPNTESWFKKWKDLLSKMLVFYPMFSLLFGASQLAGFAIIASASDGFGILLGAAVEIFPLFFAWSLMKMSGTFLNTINTKLNSIAAKPLATNRAWADSHRQLKSLRHLERNKMMPSAKLMNFLNYRKSDREAEIDELRQFKKAEYGARSAMNNYNKNGSLSKKGQRAFDRQALTAQYERTMQMHKNNMNEGFGEQSPEFKREIAKMKDGLRYGEGVYASAINEDDTSEERINRLDNANLRAFEDLRIEKEREAKIEAENAKSFYNRVMNAKFAHDDLMNVGRDEHQNHRMFGDENKYVLDDPENLKRYDRIRKIMGGKIGNEDFGVDFAAAGVVSSFAAQAQMVKNKFQTYGELTPPTQDLVNHIEELTAGDLNQNIDAVIGMLRVLKTRGDTDEVFKAHTCKIIGDAMDSGRVRPGSYIAQSFANFNMFDVGSSDPTLRRLGKFINLETAAMYNEKSSKERRTRPFITWDEFVKGKAVDYDENGNIKYNDDGTIKMYEPKKALPQLIKGTSWGDIERTAFKTPTMLIRRVAHELGPDGERLPEFSMSEFIKDEESFWEAIMANLIGDQITYKSQSEQMEAFVKEFFRIDPKTHKFDFKGAFGETILNGLGLEKKAEYIKSVEKHVGLLYKGQVSRHIQQTKSDVLVAFKNFNTLMTFLEDEDGNIDLEKLDFLEKHKFGDGELEPYEDFEKKYEKGRKKRFQNAFTEDARSSFAMAWDKGFQGEAKEKLIKEFGEENLRRWAAEKRTGKKQRQQINRAEEDEDDGVSPADEESGGGGGGLYNDARMRIESICDEYRGARRIDKDECWERIEEVLTRSPEMGDLTVQVDEFKERLPQIGDVGQLRIEVLRRFFGSD